jgi:hypothetical protein
MIPTPGTATGERRTPRAHPPTAHPSAAWQVARPAAQAVDHPDRPVPRAPARPLVRDACPACAGPWVQRAEGCLTCLSCGWSACGA